VVEQAMASQTARPQAAPVPCSEQAGRRPDERALEREQLVSRRQEEEQALSRQAQPVRLVLEPQAPPRQEQKLRMEEQALSLSLEPAEQQQRPAPRAGGERLWRLPLWQLCLPGL
jgi:hypothetical protein